MQKLLFLFLGLLILPNQAISQKGFKEKGIASYYADKFDGRTTASGEVFRNSKLTAAHKTLKFGSVVKVTNLENQKSVIVRVNDRGPYAHGRIIDLSKKAASKIGILQSGLTEVIIEVLQAESTDEENISSEEQIEDSYVISIWGTKRKAPLYGIQLASFENQDAAVKFAKSAHNKGVELPLIKVYRDKNKTFYRVMAGDFKDNDEAKFYLKDLKKIGYKGFVKKY